MERSDSALPSVVTSEGPLAPAVSQPAIDATRPYEAIVVGGGIIGLSSAAALLKRRPGLRALLLEKESRLAVHQTGRNSGVIHSGIYYRPGSLKAKLCVEGARRMIEYCRANGIAHRRCGKVIVATESEELPRLAVLEERGQANGVPGLRWIGPEELRELEPHVRGTAALHLPEVAIVDYRAVAERLAEEIRQAGGVIATSARVVSMTDERGVWRLETTRGRVRARLLVNCGGLHADRLARLARDRASVRLVPFRGEYYELPRPRAALVNGLVYPVPDPALPFLGIHLTKTLDGGVHVGPSAVLALAREGYRRRDVSWRDCAELLSQPAFWRMARRHWRAGLTEMARSWDRRRFLHAAQRLVPALQLEDLQPSPSGVRAQAITTDGTLLDDFELRETATAVHVYNAPSPAATASLSIGDYLADRIIPRLG